MAIEIAKFEEPIGHDFIVDLESPIVQNLADFFNFVSLSKSILIFLIILFFEKKEKKMLPHTRKWYVN